MRTPDCGSDFPLSLDNFGRLGQAFFKIPNQASNIQAQTAPRRRAADLPAAGIGRLILPANDL
jgi:hypothetical protein